MTRKKTIRFSHNEKLLEIHLEFDGERDSARVEIDGVPYHFERIHYTDLLTEYRVDNEPGFEPHTDKDGFCYILAPYSR